MQESQFNKTRLNTEKTNDTGVDGGEEMKKVIVVANIVIQLLWYTIAGVATYFVVRTWFDDIGCVKPAGAESQKLSSYE